MAASEAGRAGLTGIDKAFIGFRATDEATPVLESSAGLGESDPRYLAGVARPYAMYEAQQGTPCVRT